MERLIQVGLVFPLSGQQLSVHLPCREVLAQAAHGSAGEVRPRAEFRPRLYLTREGRAQASAPSHRA